MCGQALVPPHILLQLCQVLPALGREQGGSSWDLALARRALVCAGLGTVSAPHWPRQGELCGMSHGAIGGMNSALSMDCWGQERGAQSQQAGKPQKEQAAQVWANRAARRGSGPGTE